MSEREFEFLRVQAMGIREEEGRTIGEAISPPVCDFCSDRRVRWFYRCETFVLPEIAFGSDDEWIACDRCSSLIEEGDRDGLLGRAMAGWKAQGRPMLEALVYSITTIQAGFWEHRLPVPREAFG